MIRFKEYVTAMFESVTQTQKHLSKLHGDKLGAKLADNLLSTKIQDKSVAQVHDKVFGNDLHVDAGLITDPLPNSLKKLHHAIDDQGNVETKDGTKEPLEKHLHKFVKGKSKDEVNGLYNTLVTHRQNQLDGSNLVISNHPADVSHHIDLRHGKDAYQKALKHIQDGGLVALNVKGESNSKDGSYDSSSVKGSGLIEPYRTRKDGHLAFFLSDTKGEFPSHAKDSTEEFLANHYPAKKDVMYYRHEGEDSPKRQVYSDERIAEILSGPRHSPSKEELLKQHAMQDILTHKQITKVLKHPKWKGTENLKVSDPFHIELQKNRQQETNSEK